MSKTSQNRLENGLFQPRKVSATTIPVGIDSWESDLDSKFLQIVEGCSFCCPLIIVSLFSTQPLTGGVKSSSTGLGAATKPVTFSLLQSKQGEKNSF